MRQLLGVDSSISTFILLTSHVRQSQLIVYSTVYSKPIISSPLISIVGVGIGVGGVGVGVGVGSSGFISS